MRRAWTRIAGGLGLAVVIACSGCGASKEAQRPTSRQGTTSSGHFRTGEASWYGKRFQGRTTASGERFDRHQYTAAHRKLRFGTCVNVENLSNGRKVKVRINDRGPYTGGRIIDVSEAAARKLDMIEAGVARVRLRPC
ncbi:MAG TPA: septal ring lytic transglycosylase RlpA family protein [Myxococcaceae bacterium]|nr:septal ring lytic transglycosylase RlpA family protein [Myxococcaceae bacterium]